MKRYSRANKGQFSIIAALLVSVILVAAVISTYSMVRNAPLQSSPKVLTAMGEMNEDIKRMLDFTVGYYGSILQVTGNSSYAKGLTTNYLSGGLVNIARSHPEWNPSFQLNYEQVSTRWFMPQSYSMGNLSVTYDLSGLGIENVQYEASSVLEVNMLEPSNPSTAKINVIRDNNIPELRLGKENFWFYKYDYDDSTWELINPENDPVISSDGVYIIDIPSEVDQDAYSIQVEDQRGLQVSAFYSENSVASGFPQFTYNFDWDSTGLGEIYDSLTTDVMTIELLQNGTLQWLGQNLELLPRVLPIPPVPIKAFHLNQTISGVEQEVPFQVEDWASDYKIPLGLSGNASLFHNNNMIVFLVNHNVEKATLWWDGTDISNQTSYAWQNIYFTDNPDSGALDNGPLSLDVNNFYIISNLGGTSCRADFLRINSATPNYGAEPAYVIYNGVVRDILQQEPELGGGGFPDSPNVYSQIVLTLPANAPYYTYATRTIFLDSAQDRDISDLSAIQLSNLIGNPLTEDGTDGGYPETSSSTNPFDNSTNWEHHWSQFMSGNSGAGLMFTDSTNQKLYVFDSLIGDNTGAIDPSSGGVEFNPVEESLNHDVLNFQTALDVTWHGAVATFDGDDPIYRSSDDVGLWVMVENPPRVLMDNYRDPYDYVDINTINVDSSDDKGSHSDFPAQKQGPDAIYDVLAEGNTADSANTTLIDAESFEGTWPPAGWTETGYWNKESNRAYTGTYSADFDGYGYYGSSGNLVTSDLNCSDASSIFVTFRYLDEGLDYGEFLLEYFDGSSWVPITDLGTSSEYTWNLYEEQITDSRYFVSDFKIRWRANGIEDYEHAYVDLVTVTKEVASEANYELDLEVQWTDADYNEANEELCIYYNEASGGTNNTDSLDATGGYMVVGNGTPDWGSTAGTISFWIQWDTIGGRPWGQHDNMETRFYGTNLVLDWGGTNSLTSTTSFTAGKWYFIAITWNEFTNDLTLYVGDQNTAPTVDATTGSWYGSVSTVGVSQNNFLNSRGGFYQVDGHGDELRYYDTDRNLSEIQSDYNIELTGSETNLRSYFKLNSNFNDLGPDNNDGSGSGSFSFSTDAPFSITAPEDIQVDVWTGSWVTVFTNLANGWNNITISDYLTSEIFTIRFKGVTETNDTSQNFWAIDSTLLHTWS